MYNSANYDFVNVLILYYSGILPCSTNLWMIPHSLEKYFKAYLLKNEHGTYDGLKKEYIHNIKKMWGKFIEITNFKTRKPDLDRAINELIDDLKKYGTDIRYDQLDRSSNDGIKIFNFKDIYYYITLASLLRYNIIGKQAYRESRYGLSEPNIIFMDHYSDICIQSYGRVIIQKMLHLSLEHAYSFSQLGIVSCMGFEEHSISNTSIFEELEDCPICKSIKTGFQFTKEDLRMFYLDLTPVRK